MMNAGEKGYADLAFREDDHRLFYLQARPFERSLQDDPQLARVPVGTPIATAINVPLAYCPHCGEDLNRLLRSQAAAFDESAREHAGLLPST